MSGLRLLRRLRVASIASMASVASFGSSAVLRREGGAGATGNWGVGFIWDLNVELSLGVVPRRAAHSP